MSESTQRKDEHLRICLEEDVSFSHLRHSGFQDYRLEHDALPEVDFESIDTSTLFLGKKLSLPLVIGAMTGGTEHAKKINQRLALAAAHCQVGFALGSQRSLLENKDALATFEAKKWAPRLPLLFGNIGAVQLNYGAGADQVKRLIELTQCDAFNFHLNPLQELIQPEGQRNFAQLIEKISAVCTSTSTPIFLKEVGAGISEKTAAKLTVLKLAGVETAGLGGTSWAKVESLRTNDGEQRALGELLANWGIPTTESILNCRKAMPSQLIIASGGIRTGVECAKAIALGANACAMALPFLMAAEKSEDHVVELIEKVRLELKAALFLTGNSNIASLKATALKKVRDYGGAHS